MAIWRCNLTMMLLLFFVVFVVKHLNRSHLISSFVTEKNYVLCRSRICKTAALKYWIIKFWIIWILCDEVTFQTGTSFFLLYHFKPSMQFVWNWQDEVCLWIPTSSYNIDMRQKKRNDIVPSFKTSIVYVR